MSGNKSHHSKKEEFVIFDKRKKSTHSSKYSDTNPSKIENGVKKKRQNINEKLAELEKNREERKQARKLKQNKEKGKLDNQAQMTTNRLFRMKAVGPFDFFPNKVVIEEKQVILYYKQFFFTTQEYHILVPDILIPVIENSLLFATLKIEIGVGGYQQNPPPIHFLPKKEALLAKQIIMGLLVCYKEDISLEGLDNEEKIDKLIEIGRYLKD